MTDVAALAEFEPIIGSLMALGVPPSVAWGMEAWEAGLVLGDDEEGREPIILGTRQLVLPSDKADGDGKRRWRDRSLRRRMASRGREMGRVLRGDAARGGREA